METPVKDKTFVSAQFDSRRWDNFPWRDDDIVISTAMKSGTTWTIRIVGLLVNQELDRVDDKVMYTPWPDSTVLHTPEELAEELEAMKTRRFLKCHVPLDTIPYHPKVKYINVVRHPLDNFRSMRHHWRGIRQHVFDLFESNGWDDLPPYDENVSVKEYFRRWMTEGLEDWEEDGWPMQSPTHFAKSFWDYRHLDNILLLHYTNMTDDLGREVSRIADFLEIEITPEVHERIVELATFDTMKKQTKALNPHFDDLFKHGGDGFMQKGGLRTWEGLLDDEDLALYEDRMSRLDPEFRNWYENGVLT